MSENDLRELSGILLGLMAFGCTIPMFGFFMQAIRNGEWLDDIGGPITCLTMMGILLAVGISAIWLATNPHHATTPLEGAIIAGGGVLLVIAIGADHLIKRFCPSYRRRENPKEGREEPIKKPDGWEAPDQWAD
jgi:hypothetical protein